MPSSSPPSKVYSAAVVGIDAEVVEVETDVSYGLRHFEIVGLGDKAIEESKERIGVALRSAGFRSPQTQPLRVLVNLAPADVKKEGSLYDLPIALGFLLSSRQGRFETTGILAVGELSLDGNLRPIKGSLAFALLAQDRNYHTIILPKANATEAAAALGAQGTVRIIGVETLKEAVSFLEGSFEIPSVNPPEFQEEVTPSPLLFIHGQEYAKRALEIAAAGMHNLMFQGPPGTGKTLLAKAIASFLPPLEFEESLEVTKIYSIAGMLPPQQALIRQPPFRNPHHASSEVALLGGGNPPRAGEITLAHRGVLFLDEFPEFHRDVLESLRQPLEEGSITVLRARHQLTLPAQFMLVAASNPCPCGFYRDPERECSCTPPSIQKYKRKLSGPLMDRIDMFVDVPQVKYEEIKKPTTESEQKEQAIKQRVRSARNIQKERLGAGKTNAHMDLADIKQHCHIDEQSDQLLQKYVDSGRLSLRGYHRVLKLARTITDLEAAEKIAFDHITEALSYRTKNEI